MGTRPEGTTRMRIGLILVAAILATGIAAAVIAAAMQPVPPTPTPRAVPPLPPTATAPVRPPASGRQLVPAPIDKLDVRVGAPAPARYTLSVQAGLPSGCAQQGTHSVSRSGDVITVTVLNSMPTGNQVCKMIYGMYDLSIDFGSAFTSGTTYTVRVNDKTTSFTAQ